MSRRALGVSAAVLLLVLAIQPGPARAATQVGFKGPSYSGFGAESTGGAVTGEKPESKLWHHAGSWWAVMVSASASGAKTIWRLGGSTWINTNVVVDTRPWTKEDVLSDGNTLYVASRGGSETAGNLLRRFTYANGTYALAAGFPKSIPGADQETLTLAKDSTKRLWITYEKNGAIYVSHSLATDTSWTPEFVLPVSQASQVSDDDISSVVAFTDNAGPAVGVMFSDQPAGTDYFAVHRDGAPDSQWTVEAPLTGGVPADDHINLKTVEGRIYAAVKTEDPSGSETLIWLLVRSKSGVWQKHSVATADEVTTRPITVLHLDATARRIHVFMTLGEGDAAQGIVSKSSDMDSVGFPSQSSFVLRGPNDETINNVTSTKLSTHTSTGIVILASDGANYWWNRLAGVQGAQVGVVRGNAWLLTDETLIVTKAFYFGSASDTKLVGDWDENGTFTPGVVKGNKWYLNNSTDPNADIVFAYGSASDTKLVGDWDENGTFTAGVVKGNTWYLNNNTDPKADVVFSYGSASDTKLVGDWDGNGTFTPGVVKGNTWYLNNNTDGNADIVFSYGGAGDTKLVGDWDGNGTFTPGVVKGNIWYLNNNTDPKAELVFSYGNPTDAKIAGDWNG